MKQIAILASGKGSNAEQLIKHFENHNSIEVALVITDNPFAGVIEIAFENGIECLVLDKDQRKNMVHYLVEFEIDFIVLAGYLKKLGPQVIRNFENKIVNIHPSLLPKYGGKGMYGQNVHKAVLLNKEIETGITIHKVNEEYDQGSIVFQKSIKISEVKTVGEIIKLVQQLEHQYFAKVVEEYIIGYK